MFLTFCVALLDVSRPVFAEPVLWRTPRNQVLVLGSELVRPHLSRSPVSSGGSWTPHMSPETQIQVFTFVKLIFWVSSVAAKHFILRGRESAGTGSCFISICGCPRPSERPRPPLVTTPPSWITAATSCQSRLKVVDNGGVKRSPVPKGRSLTATCQRAFGY